MAQCVIDPQSSLVLLLARRVNSAIGERVGLDLLRIPRRPVVTDSSIDPRPRPFAASLTSFGPSAQAPNEGASPLKLPRST